MQLNSFLHQRRVKLVPEQGTSKIFGRGQKGTESQKPGQIIFADIIGSLMIMMTCRLDVVEVSLLHLIETV